MITDARGPNAVFKVPPGVNLVTGEGLGKIEVELPSEAHLHSGFGFKLSLALGLLDVQDCFHRDRVPISLARYFCWEPVPAKLVGLEGHWVEGKLLGPLDAVYPCAGSLCQGFSWSLYFAQRANERTARQTGSLRDAGILQDRGEAPVFRPSSSPSKIYFYIYVDNIGVLCCCVGPVKRAVKQLKHLFKKVGLDLHGEEINIGASKALGCCLDGKRLETRIDRDRMWKMHQAIDGLLIMHRCSGRMLEVITRPNGSSLCT